jgi:hypothetical protein
MFSVRWNGRTEVSIRTDGEDFNLSRQRER